MKIEGFATTTVEVQHSIRRVLKAVFTRTDQISPFSIPKKKSGAEEWEAY
jgi:hypothetical protein